MSELTLASEAPPLRRDAHGAYRVGTSRVLLDVVVAAFEQGATPEGIVQSYPTAGLADVYGVIAYYLRHRDEVRAYLAERERLAEENMAKALAHPDAVRIRERLLARAKERAEKSSPS